jgi:signal transduction histidine kinase/CheY-like chemotaxis protein
MTELIADARTKGHDQGSTEPVMEILKSVYVDAIVRLHPSRTARVEFDGGYSISVGDLEEGLWEDAEYLDSLIETSNHLELPRSRPVRILACSCESLSGPSLLVVASNDFHIVFDDVDLWFIQGCAELISQIWHTRLLEEAMKAKEKFLRAFSHQLRTPIHGILGSVELLTEELLAQNSSKSLPQTLAIEQNLPASNCIGPFTYLNMIETAGRDLTSVINNLISLNKWSDIAMAERQYSLYTFDDLETELENEFNKLTAGDARCTASVFFTHNLSQSHVTFNTDLMVLRDTLLPLIINAVRHTPAGVVSIMASADTEKRQLIIDIEDTGQGIHPDHQKRIFEQYEKVDLHSTGAGLGLTLASKFALLINGSIDLVSSEVDRGSLFRATFHDVEWGSLPSPKNFGNLPRDFFTMKFGSDDTLPSDHFASYLVRNGLTRSESIQGSLVIFEDASDNEKHEARVAQIPTGQVAICLLPKQHDRSTFDETQSDVIYLSGHFMTSKILSALVQAQAKAQTYATIRTCQPCSPELLASDESISGTPSPEVECIVKNENIDPFSPGNHRPENPISQALHKQLSPPLESLTATPFFRTSSRPQVLIVDDNAVNVRVMEKYCQKRGLPFVSAADGLQAVQTFSHQQCDGPNGEISDIQLIFMDLQMPVCGGIEATRQIRSLELRNKWTKSCLFVMTGQDSSTDRRAAEEVGADEYLVKPVSLGELDLVVGRHFPSFATGRE